ncbi:Hypothetical protein A7982_05943 [Minicystis rosea]|nr:Hypothetical protein A7982_05943 [Minicystis rosea]
MIDPRRLVLATLVSAIGSALGCAPSEARSAATVEIPRELAAPIDPATAGEKAATFRVLNHLGWPFRLARVQMVADGTEIRHAVAADRELPATIAASVTVAPGPHVFHLVASARVKLTAIGPACTVTLRSAIPFVAEATKPADITADLYLRDATRRFEERLDLRTRLSGVGSDTGSSARLPAADEARCGSLRAPERVMCRVEAMVAEAVRARDVVKVLCYRDKLDPMRVIARMRDEAWAQAEALRASDGERHAPRRSPTFIWNEVPAAPTEARLDEAEYRDRVLVLDRQIEILGREADQCIGEDLGDPIGPRVTVDDCFATGAPEIDPELLGPRMPGNALPAPAPWAF